MNTALLVIDVQVIMFEPLPVHQADTVLANIQTLIGRARAAGAAVIFVRHNGGPGEPEEPGTPGWPLHPALPRQEEDLIIDKHTPDSFYQTELAGVLAARGIRRLVIAGMQTEYCIDTTTRRAFSMAYDVILAADAHSTFGNGLAAEQIIAHHNGILRSFARVLPSAEIAFDALPDPAVNAAGLTAADLSAIAAGLDEWHQYDRWLSTGKGAPFWPHTHPGRVADTLKKMWKPDFKPQTRYLDPPLWGMGLARTFLQPLENIPMAFRRSTLTEVARAVDHLLQNPRNPLSPHINQTGENIWLYDARDLRLFYVPHVTADQNGVEHHYIFLLWLAPGLPVRNPFA